VGIASHRAATQAGVSFLRPDLLFTDVEAIGVARHARNPDGAVRLLEWLVADHTLNGEQEPAVDNVGIVAWHYEEAIRLAERARYP
jgi:hypothetical protein